MNRNEFLRNSLLLGGALAIPAQRAFAGNLVVNGIDRLVDEQGNFVHQPLPFAENALEPYMDAETVHLHYTFHHGNAVKAANKYQGKIKDCLDKGDFENVDFYAKKRAKILIPQNRHKSPIKASEFVVKNGIL